MSDYLSSNSNSKVHLLNQLKPSIYSTAYTCRSVDKIFIDNPNKVDGTFSSKFLVINGNSYDSNTNILPITITSIFFFFVDKKLL